MLWMLFKHPGKTKKYLKGATAMKKFISYEKLSKKAQKKINAAKRGSWGDINPVTKTVKNKKAYDRSKFKKLAVQY